MASTETNKRPDLQQLRSEIDQVMRSVREFDEQIEKRNEERWMLVEQLRDYLPQEQFERFEKVIEKICESVTPSPDPSELPPLQIDEQNPLESLRNIRCQIAQDVCQTMGVEPPHVA